MSIDNSLIAKEVSKLSTRLEDTVTYNESNLIRPGYCLYNDFRDVGQLSPSVGTEGGGGLSLYRKYAPYFALEKRYIGAPISDYYKLGERIYYIYAMPGDVILAWTTSDYDTPHEVTYGDPLYTNYMEPGTLTIETSVTGPRPQPPTAVALETLALAVVPRRILVEVC